LSSFRSVVVRIPYFL